MTRIRQDIDPISDDLPDIEMVRERVLDALALLRSANILSSIDPSLPPERVAFELCRMWFDAIYTPGHRYMEGYKGDRDEDAALDFESAFTEDEFEYLERFNRFLELRIDRLSSKDRENGRFPSSDTWRGIMRDADNLLELIEGDLRKVRRLEGVEMRMTALLETGGWKGVLEQRSLES